jgi:polysaccharide biosynthesis/export protein
MTAPAVLILMTLVQAQAPASPSSASPQTQKQTGPSVTTDTTDYVVGPQDVLSVAVYGVPELTRDVIVDSDGTFDFPMLGRIQASGKGVRQIEAEIKQMLTDRKYFAVEPTVNVDVKSYRSQSVWVVGAVRNPSMQKIAGNASVMSVLADAGFNTKSGSYILVTHRPKNAKNSGPITETTAGTIRISRKDLETGRAQNVHLQDGDTIFVPEAERYVISGYVHSPGSYEIDGDLTVLQALAQAGGASEQAAQNRIEIERMENGKMVKIRVKLTDPVKPGDTIIVPRRWM